MKRTRLEVTVLLAALSVPAFAQGLSDPTRPPVGFDAAASGVKDPESAPAALVLESVLIHPDARTAIISGERLALGQKIRGMRLVRIAESEVVLLDGGERRTLKLYPGVQKKLASPNRAQPGG
jgi:MSHA biogenesis protein MshK